jgi:hypothetical protein
VADREEPRSRIGSALSRMWRMNRRRTDFGIAAKLVRALGPGASFHLSRYCVMPVRGISLRFAPSRSCARARLAVAGET